mmetsp:Transcript_93140/g.221570  ORF Transcript_93140/g.221570 Transcript_93140/m.221570 type:complete len:221 (-) Transcript_93140:111-773(-)
MIQELWSLPKFPCIRPVGRSKVMPKRTPARSAIARPMPKPLIGGPRDAAGFTTSDGNSSGGPGAAQAASWFSGSHTSLVTWGPSASPASVTSAFAAKEKKTKEVMDKPNPRMFSRGLLWCSFCTPKSPKCPVNQPMIILLKSQTVSPRPIPISLMMYGHIRFPHIQMAPPTAAHGSNTGIVSPGVLVSTMPVNSPTKRMPTDMTAEKKIPSPVSMPFTGK